MTVRPEGPHRILVMIFWSLWVGLIIALVGLIAFGGFARGKWY